MTDDVLGRYLENRADLRTRALEAASTADVDRVIAIPLLAEGRRISDVLVRIGMSDPALVARTLVICVVNNPAAERCDSNILADNRGTLKLLARMARGEFAERLNGLRVGYVDASSPGYALPAKEGVGTARKLGLDWGMHVLRENGATNGALICLDGDTRVEPTYLEAIAHHYRQPDAWGGVIEYAHSFEGAASEQAAIVCYEIFLRYYVFGLQYARSPYAFHTIGSTMTCSPAAYAAVGGMNRRQAGEDFYFLQQLAKTGPVRAVTGTTVHPSPRPSWRVPFGTGKRVQRFLDGKRDEYKLYHPQSFEVVRRWLAVVEADPEQGPDDLMDEAAGIAPSLEAFLRSTYFEKAWARILDNASSPEQAREQFHRWFDGFKTLKLIHHLRDDVYSLDDMFDAVRTLLQRLDFPWRFGDPARLHGDLDRQKALLEALRAWSLMESPDAALPTPAGDL